MEQRLKKLFDFQKLVKNPRLEKIIEEAHSLQSNKLNDSDLDFVAAAGEPLSKTIPFDKGAADD